MYIEIPRFGDKIKSLRSTFGFSNGITNSLSVLKKRNINKVKNFIASKDNTIKSNVRKNLLEAKRNESIKKSFRQKREEFTEIYLDLKKKRKK